MEPTQTQLTSVPDHHDPVARQATPEEHPGRTISIVGLVFAFTSLAIPGLVLSIIGMVKSKKANQPNVIALLGIIFNSLAIVVTALFIAFYATLFITGFSVGYRSNSSPDEHSGASMLKVQAADIKRHADAVTLRDAAAIYQNESRDGLYPRNDAIGFQEDISTVTSYQSGLGSPVEVDTAISDHITSSLPDAVHPNDYKISYCGGTTVQTATGVAVYYWSAETGTVLNIVTGMNCD